MNKTDTKVFALGGLGEVGKNMYVVMYENKILTLKSFIYQKAFEGKSEIHLKKN